MDPGIKSSDLISFAVVMLNVVKILEVAGEAGQVAIDPAYFPALYVKNGEDIRLTCRGKDVELVWFRDTQGGEEKINATPESEFRITLVRELPSLNVSNILTKKHATYSDTGHYICSDKDRNNEFVVKVTVVYVLPEYKNTNMLDMSCTVAGFDSNPPEIMHMWSFNDTMIPHESKHYNITGREDRMSIQKSHVVREDTGYYECVFTFRTNVKLISVSHRMQFDASAYAPKKGTASHNTSWLCTIVAAVTSAYFVLVHT